MKAVCIWVLQCCALLLMGISTRTDATHPLSLMHNGVELKLAHDGKAMLPIIVHAEASAEVKAAAKELADYLKKISSAEFQIQTGDGSAGIVLGTIEQFKVPDDGGKLEMRGTLDGKEAYLVRSEEKRLLLLGRTDLAVSHAAFRFLEILGCRWFFPAREWEVIPTNRDLTINADETSRPAILARRIWYGWGFFHEKEVPEGKVSAEKAYRDWARHNRMAGSFTVNAGHAWEEIVQQNKSSFDQHPEYFALVKEKRTGPQLCTSHAEVRRMAVEYARNHFRKHPKSDMVSMEAADGGGQCDCEDCKKIGSISDRVFGLANHVAKAIQAEFPGKQVGVLAYNEHCEPPGFALEPNVYVQLTAGFITGQYTFDELVNLWPEKCKNMGFYEYFSVWLWDFDKLPGGRGANLPYIQKQIQLYASKGATSMDAESGNNWGVHGRGYYLANRLMWNPNAEVEPILADFYDKAFGKGAKAMRRYYERMDPGNSPLMSRHLMGLAFRDVEEAARMAGDDQAVQARLDHIKQYLRYVHLRWLLDRETDETKKKELLKQTFTHLWRTRYSFMNHWEAVRQAWIPEAAKAVGESSWTTAQAPWISQGEYSPEETEKGFQEGLSYFQPEAVTERTFSKELVPISFPNYPAKENSQSYQGGLSYALYGRKDETLELEVVTGTIAWYRDRADARYKWTDPSEKIVDAGRLPLDGKPHKLTLKAPETGLYYFNFNDTDAGWVIKSGTNQGIAILLQKDRAFAHQGWMQPIYFYVPQGTEELQYYWSGGPHKIYGPDSKLIQQVKTSGDFVKVAVPKGADGKLWHFSELALGHLWFFNAPNVVSGNPSIFLLPKELVED